MRCFAPRLLLSVTNAAALVHLIYFIIFSSSRFPGESDRSMPICVVPLGERIMTVSSNKGALFVSIFYELACVEHSSKSRCTSLGSIILGEKGHEMHSACPIVCYIVPRHFSPVVSATSHCFPLAPCSRAFSLDLVLA